jgi:primosomal protein N'
MTLKSLTLACNHCGASLKIGVDTRFVTCAYCATQLEVRREDGAAFTSVKKAVENLAHDVAALKIEKQIARLDRDWKRKREARRQANVSIGISVALGAGSVLLMLRDGLEQFALLGLLGALGIAILGIVYRGAAAEYQRAEQAHERARAALETRLRDPSSQSDAD